MGERLLIVLDTHIFLWLDLELQRIPAKIASAIEKTDTLGIPAISLWEIAMLSAKGRIELPLPVLPWLQEALSQKNIILLPITPEIAACSGTLEMHGDPADRLIAATAITSNCPLATVDGNLLALPGLQTIP
jgi:PIN domain nuclease of toxin-antitoxin system